MAQLLLSFAAMEKLSLLAASALVAFGLSVGLGYDPTVFLSTASISIVP